MVIVLLVIIVLQEGYAFVVSRDLARELRSHFPEIYSDLGNPDVSYFSRRVSFRLFVYVFGEAKENSNTRIRGHSTYLRWVWLFRAIEIMAIVGYLSYGIKT